MAQYKQNNTVVEILRDARSGDHGFNPARGKQVVIKNPDSGFAGNRVVSLDTLVKVPDASDAPKKLPPAPKPAPVAREPRFWPAKVAEPAVKAAKPKGEKIARPKSKKRK